MGKLSLVGRITRTDLKTIAVAGGNVMHAIKSHELSDQGFGEAYFSWIEGGAVKAWKLHTKMTLNLVAPLGMVMFKFLDEDGAERTEIIGDERYCRLTVPPNIWFGFKDLSGARSLILSVADIPHDPNEVLRKDIDFFDVDWSF
jgi:dTDP-4-dehydrorhamnose 3,5-epimerase